ncbi:50S ribosomal protein L18 [Candidatus Aerophobetes bacterium]|uniref:Large ribosomal subunit protein uL18 n=1 Tax=Aerophobetes bacterium TaxID=2030807 RepID=A0A2A4YMP3_UNCAE|nr:MAG: 50S ribosomal protein L18 [Candidatus Aerophobetes bacterium]
MYNYLNKRNQVRKKRALRVRKHLRGTSEKPRMSVAKSNKHLTIQVIDDETGITLASFGSNFKDFDKKVKARSKESAKLIGSKIAEQVKSKNIQQMVFDRGRFKYHGIIAEIVTAVRDSGLKI